MTLITSSVTELVREVASSGPENAEVIILTEAPTWSDRKDGLLSDFAGRQFLDQFERNGLRKYKLRLESICQRVPPNRNFFALTAGEREAWKTDCLSRLSAFKPNVIVAVGEEPLRFLTSEKGISKWHMSILEGFGGQKVIPVLSPEYVQKKYPDIAFLIAGIRRVVEESKSPVILRTERNFVIEPGMSETLAYLRDYCNKAEWLSVDIETGRGQITCIGFAPNERNAICIPTLPSQYGEEEFYTLWTAIAETLSKSTRKIFQNGIYDTTYLSKYGIRTLGFANGHDTMLAQKLLQPELPIGLDTIGRLHTREVYWKDEGKDWGDKQDTAQLYLYNCKDAAHTFEAAMSQRMELKQRGLLELFDNFYQTQTLPVAEMSWRGFRVDEVVRAKLLVETQIKFDTLERILNIESQELLKQNTNPRSPIQVKELIKVAGFRVPILKGKETTAVPALKKLRLKTPESRILDSLIKISAEGKKISSYLNYAYDPDGRVRYTLRVPGTETFRFSCSKDPWNRGLNAQTIPSGLKQQFIADYGCQLLNVDLKQADGRFVAWDAGEPRMIQMYQDGVDIHRFVASQPELFNKPMNEVTKDERQLGKKTGHGANYGLLGKTHQTACLNEMDLVLTEVEATAGLEAYHREFCRIRPWHKALRDEVRITRRLRNPLGFERYFWNRMDDNLFRETYPFRPSSTVAGIINFLMLHLVGHAELLIQVHDSLLLNVPEAKLKSVIERIKDQDAWNPTLRLKGGDLRIPIEISVGSNYKQQEEVYAG